MADPVSWLLVERGWSVVATGGARLGSVEEVIGDPDADIFNGLAVSAGLLGKVYYVPAERVSAIREGSVELDLDRGGFDALDEHEPGRTVT
jgi:uncharacterized protein YrrD